MLAARWIVIGCWLMFMTIWIAMAFRTKRTIERQKRSAMRLYLWPMLAALLLVGLPVQREGLLSALVFPILPHTPAIFWSAAAAASLGLAIAIWARVSLGRNWSGEVMLKEGHELVTHGPYAAIRHPIYTALLLLFAGLVLVNGASSALLGMALMFLSCWIKLRQEEALMLRTFPDAYPAYLARTKRLVPFLV